MDTPRRNLIGRVQIHVQTAPGFTDLAISAKGLVTVKVETRAGLYGSGRTRLRATVATRDRAAGKNSVAIASTSRVLDHDVHPRLCAAILDPLTFGRGIVETGTDSYPLAQTKATARAASGHTAPGPAIFAARHMP
jgi:hypothetical protein